MQAWEPPSDWLRITTIDAHTAGEPLRIVTSGLGPIPGDSIAAKRAYARDHLDDVRRILMWEPRGHADMYGAILTEPERADSDHGVLFVHNEGFSTMCGHGIIALASVGVATGLVGNGDTTPITFDTPAGLVLATPHEVDGVMSHASFRNVPSFVLRHDLVVDVAGVGDVVCDVAYGGAFYAYVDAQVLGLELTPANTAGIIDLGRRITRRVAETIPFEHPAGDAELEFLYGTIFVGPAHGAAAHSRNVCVFADGEVDRSPTGTGVSGRLAIHHSRGEVEVGASIEIESILGTTFTGRVADVVMLAGTPAVVPEVTGSSWLTGRHEFFVDPRDPLAHSFLLR